MKTWTTFTFLLLFCAISFTSNAFYIDEGTPSVEAQALQFVNINKADLETLSLLKGVGEKRAQAIISYRELNGDFASIDELRNIKGIGDKVLMLNKDRITL